jgi:hypothetical protein
LISPYAMPTNANASAPYLRLTATKGKNEVVIAGEIPSGAPRPSTRPRLSQVLTPQCARR